MKIRLTQIDGKLPNLALMRLGAWYRGQGADVFWEHAKSRQLGEPDYDRVYASSIFSTSAKAVVLFREQFPEAIVGGSGAEPPVGPMVRTECYVPSQFRGLDYSGYPRFTASIGYSSRGCRSKCKFCGVPRWEGAVYSVASINQVWRGDPFPKRIHLLDNDFFGNPGWRNNIDELEAGGFQVCINQGFNVRRIGPEEAAAVARLHYKDDQFKRPRLYVAWDNLGDERIFFQGIDLLEAAGVKPHHIMAYMLVGFDPKETMERVLYRHRRMVERGILPYPMVHNRTRQSDPEHWRKLKRFASWAVSPAQGACAFEDFRPDHKPPPEPGALLELMD
jgi:hypothetical protein